VQRAVAQLPEAKKSKPAIVQAPLAQTAQTVASVVHQPGAQLPWKPHCLLLDKLAAPASRLCYAGKTVEHGNDGD
jgi:hypothetical protein